MVPTVPRPRVAALLTLLVGAALVVLALVGPAQAAGRASATCHPACGSGTAVTSATTEQSSPSTPCLTRADCGGGGLLGEPLSATPLVAPAAAAGLVLLAGWWVRRRPRTTVVQRLLAAGLFRPPRPGLA